MEATQMSSDTPDSSIQPLKKNEIMPFAATWMDPQIIILHKISQTEKDKYHDIIYEEAKKMIQINLFIIQTHRHRTQTYGYQRGKRGKDKLGINR